MNALTLAAYFPERIHEEALPEERYGFHKGGTAEVILLYYVNSCADSVRNVQLLRNATLGCPGEWFELGRMLTNALFACRTFHSLYKFTVVHRNCGGRVHCVPFVRVRVLIIRLMSRKKQP